MKRSFWMGIVVAAFSLSLSLGSDAAPKEIKAVPTLAAHSDDLIKQDARVRKLLPAETLKKGIAAGKALAAKSFEGKTEAAILDAARAEAAKIVTTKGADIDALVQLVMFECQQENDAELRELIEALKKTNAAKEKVRAEAKALAVKGAKVGKKVPQPGWLKKVSEAKTKNLAIAYKVIPDTSPTDCEFKGSSPADTLDGCLAETTAKEESLGEMSEMMSLRLQMLMDRRSKFISTLSNIMKKVATTQDTLISNLK